MDETIIFLVYVYIVKELDGTIYAFKFPPYESYHKNVQLYSKDYNSYIIMNPDLIDFPIELGEIIDGTMIATPDFDCCDTNK
jgi:hypothetical protein